MDPIIVKLAANLYSTDGISPSDATMTLLEGLKEEVPRIVQALKQVARTFPEDLPETHQRVLLRGYFEQFVEDPTLCDDEPDARGRERAIAPGFDPADRVAEADEEEEDSERDRLVKSAEEDDLQHRRQLLKDGLRTEHQQAVAIALCKLDKLTGDAKASDPMPDGVPGDLIDGIDDLNHSALRRYIQETRGITIDNHTIATALRHIRSAYAPLRSAVASCLHKGLEALERQRNPDRPTGRKAS